MIAEVSHLEAAFGVALSDRDKTQSSGQQLGRVTTEVLLSVGWKKQFGVLLLFGRQST
jgi:hypothetical protein